MLSKLVATGVVRRIEMPRPSSRVRAILPAPCPCVPFFPFREREREGGRGGGDPASCEPRVRAASPLVHSDRSDGKGKDSRGVSVPLPPPPPIPRPPAHFPHYGGRWIKSAHISYLTCFLACRIRACADKLQVPSVERGRNLRSSAKREPRKGGGRGGKERDDDDGERGGRRYRDPMMISTI